MEKTAQDEAQDHKDQDRKDQIRLLIGAALGGGAGYLLTRYGAGSKDLPLNLIGTGLGAGTGAALAHQLGAQAKAEDALTEQARRHAETAAGYKGLSGFQKWHMPFVSDPELAPATDSARRFLLPTAVFTGGAAAYSDRMSQLIPNTLAKMKKPISTPAPAGSPPGTKPTITYPTVLRRATATQAADYTPRKFRAMSGALAAAVVLAGSELLRHSVANVGASDARSIANTQK